MTPPTPDDPTDHHEEYRRFLAECRRVRELAAQTFRRNRRARHEAAVRAAQKRPDEPGRRPRRFRRRPRERTRHPPA